MVYFITLVAEDLKEVQNELQVRQRLTKPFPKRTRMPDQSGPPLALVLTARDDGQQERRSLAWIGTVAKYGVSGPLDQNITVDPLRQCPAEIPLTGQGGLLEGLSEELREEFVRCATAGTVQRGDWKLWEAIKVKLKGHSQQLAELLDWLEALASPVALDPSDPADRSWQEQRDAAMTGMRLAGFPTAVLAAWHRPRSRDKPYLSGLLAAPIEPSLIDYDFQQTGIAFGMAESWERGDGVRCDIHVLRSEDGRVLEVMNANASPVETRFGTDLIYYHHPTESFVLVQYKRLGGKNKPLRVDDRMLDQVRRLEMVQEHSRFPTRPLDWRLGKDACFFKLAYWPESTQNATFDSLCPGMYLPLSYLKLLLRDDCTLSSRKGSQGRLLGYKQVERHIVSSQFVELVKHGLAGTVGTSLDQLGEIVKQRVAEGSSVMSVFELGRETVAERQARSRDRGSKPLQYTHSVQETLFGE